MNRKLLLLTILAFNAVTLTAKDYRVTSPDGKLQITIHATADKLTWEVSHDGTAVLTSSEIGINGTLKKTSGLVNGNSVVVSNSSTPWSSAPTTTLQPTESRY